MTKWRQTAHEHLSRPLTWANTVNLFRWLLHFAWKLLVWLLRWPARNQASFYSAAAWSPARRNLFLAVGLGSLVVLGILPFYSRNFTWTLYRHLPGLPQEFPAAIVAKQHLESFVDWTLFALIFGGIRAIRARLSLALGTFDIVTAKNEWGGAVSVHVDTPLTQVRASFVLNRVLEMTRALASASSVVRLEFHSPRLDEGHAAFAKRVQRILGGTWQVTSSPDVAMSRWNSWAYRLLVRQGTRKPKVSESRVFAAMVVARRIGAACGC